MSLINKAIFYFFAGNIALTVILFPLAQIYEENPFLAKKAYALTEN